MPVVAVPPPAQGVVVELLPPASAPPPPAELQPISDLVPLPTEAPGWHPPMAPGVDPNEERPILVLAPAHLQATEDARP